MPRVGIAPFWGSANLPKKVSHNMGYRSDSISEARNMGPLSGFHAPDVFGPHPQYGWDFPEEILAKFRKEPETLSERFLEFPSRVRLGCPKPYTSRHPSPPQYGWGLLFFQKWFWRGPLRAGHGIPGST